MDEFRSVLKDLRSKAGLSQKALAELAGIDPSHLNRMERGIRRPPKRRTVLAIADALMLSSEKRVALLKLAGQYNENSSTDDKTHAPSLPDKSLLFGSPISPNFETSHPAIRLVSSVLTDQTIKLEKRKQIADQIISFTNWLRHEANKCQKEKTTKNGRTEE